MTQHAHGATPGPWTLNDFRPQAREVYVMSPVSTTIALLRGEWQSNTSANARLIAAAPDLLRVARSALLVLLQHAPDDYTEATIRDLQVAIAKATEEVQT